MNEIRLQAEAIVNPAGSSWRDYVLSSFSGPISLDFREPKTVLVIYLDAVDFASGVISDGSFEYSSRLPFANLGSLEGTLNAETREFSLIDQSPNDKWKFSGRFSENGRVMYLTLSDDSRTSSSFFLIHEETFADLIPDEPEQGAAANP